MFVPMENQRICRDEQYPPGTISPEEFVRIEDLFRQDMFRVDFANAVREGSKLKALLRVSWRVQTSGDNPTFQEQSRTLAYFDRPGMPTPAFTLAPSSGAQGFLQNMLAGVSGLGIDFPDFPEFGKKFSVMTFFPRSTRALLTEKLRRVLLERVGVTVQTGTDGRIAIYQSGFFPIQADSQEFLKIATELAECIFESATLLKANDRPNGEEVIEAYKSMGALGPSKDLLVTKAEVTELLSQPCPRNVSRKLLNRSYGGSSVFILIGSGFITLSLAFLFFFSYASIIFLPSLIAIVGVLFIYLAMRYRKRRKRLLTDGACASLKVNDVQASNTYEKNTRLYFVTIVGGAGPIVLEVHGEAAALARKRKASGDPIKVLIDPFDPSKVVWVEPWAIDTCIDADLSK